jgi:hypothetical protein
MGQLARPDGYSEEPPPVQITVRPKEALPPEMTLPAAPERQNMLERNLPPAYDPLSRTQQAIASKAFEFSPMGSLADLYDTFQARDAPGFGMAAAAAFPAAKVAKGVKKAADAAIETLAPAHKAGTVVEQAGIARPSVIERFVTDPQRIYKPGIYKRPDVIAREANEMVAPEHPALKELFGVTRDDLYEISQQGRRQGNIIDPGLFQPGKPGGSYAAENIMKPANAQRLIDTLTEARKYPGLERGMVPWYVMDPAFKRMVELVGFDRAKAEYDILNSMMTPFSASSDVMKEINRGTGARMMMERGGYPEFVKYGGMPVEKRGADFPPEMKDIIPHLRHAPTHTDPVSKWLATGRHGYADNTVKIPLYTQASGVPETGFQTRFPVPDAHFTRAVGMSDVRENAGPGNYMGGSEYRTFGPWFRENVSKPLGIEAVPTQALTWGAFAPQTGVKTPIGAGKLELISQRIWERAQKLGIDPKKLRDDVLMGKEHALWILGIPAAGGAASQLGGVAAQDQYQ